MKIPTIIKKGETNKNLNEIEGLKSEIANLRATQEAQQYDKENPPQEKNPVKFPQEKPSNQEPEITEKELLATVAHQTGMIYELLYNVVQAMQESPEQLDKQKKKYHSVNRNHNVM